MRKYTVIVGSAGAFLIALFFAASSLLTILPALNAPYLFFGITGSLVFTVFLFILTNQLYPIYGKNAAIAAAVFFLLTQSIKWIYSFDTPLLKVLPVYDASVMFFQFLLFAAFGISIVFFITRFNKTNKFEGRRKVLSVCSVVFFSGISLIELLLTVMVSGNIRMTSSHSDSIMNVLNVGNNISGVLSFFFFGLFLLSLLPVADD